MTETIFQELLIDQPAPFPKRAMKRDARPRIIVSDRRGSYRAAMDLIGNASSQERQILFVRQSLRKAGNMPTHSKIEISASETTS